MAFLNYHHLRYFRAIASELNLRRAAEKLNLSPPALSIQLKQLEESLGHALFERGKGGLKLTAAGRVALDYAEIIGRHGEELLDVMSHRAPGARRQILRVGAVATLSRNFQLEFLRPALHRINVEVVIRSGSMRQLLLSLQSHEVDVVLSNQAARRDAGTAWHGHLLADQAVGLVGAPVWGRKRLKFPDDFHDVPVILPSVESSLRTAFDQIVSAAKVQPRVLAEVDDMAMMRLLAREGEGLALVPPVVVRDEIRQKELIKTHDIPGIHETFYAITPTRKFPNPLVAELVHTMMKAGGIAQARPRGKSKTAAVQGSITKPHKA
ncbi:MAG: LysR family transcriptional regulator [Opitutaceae bacterium]